MIVPHRRAPPQATDAELMVQISAGALGSLGELYDRYQADVRRVLLRIGMSGADTDDLVQVTFLELPKLSAAFDGRASARSWIVGIAVRLASRRRRSVARWVRALSELVHVSPRRVAGDPETTTRERQELRAFQGALEGLSADKRNVFVLVEMEGVSPADVAASLRIPPVTVRTRLFNARAELRHAMKGVR